MNQIQRITFQNGALQVPNTPIIPFIEGDGVGRDIWPATRRVTDAAIRHAYGTERRIDWLEVPAGEMARRISQQPLPINSMDTLQRHPIAIKGPLETPVGGGMRSLNVMLRQALDLYVCLRPVRWFRGVEAPVRHPEKVDMVIFRENTEDIYAGIEWEQGTPEAGRLLQFLRDEMQVSQIRFPATSSLGVKPVSREGSERLVRAAIRYALRTGRRSVTLVHKGNIMKYTEGGFRKWGYALAEREFGAAIASGQLTVNDVIADAFLQNTLLRPGDYSVVATLNLNGDYVSDQLAAMVGGIGIAPGANINYETGHAIFEATHGTAPDIAGRGVANPSSLLLSAAMMLEYMGWDEAARLITQSIEAVLQQKRATADLARLMTASTTLGTEDFASELIAALQDM